MCAACVFFAVFYVLWAIVIMVVILTIIHTCGFSSACDLRNINHISMSQFLRKAGGWQQGCSEIMCLASLQVSPIAQALLLEGKCLWSVFVSIKLPSDMWLCYIHLFCYQRLAKLRMPLTVVQHSAKNLVRDSETYCDLGHLLVLSLPTALIERPNAERRPIGPGWSRCPNCSSISERNKLVETASWAFA